MIAMVPSRLSQLLIPVVVAAIFSSFASTACAQADEAPEKTEAKTTAAETADSDIEEPSAIRKLEKRADEYFGEYLVKPLGTALFFELGTGVPFVVAWLMAGAIFFTVRMGLINFRGFFHALRVTKGDYDDPNDTGEVTHFQALASALSATVGLGNIGGVAIAVGAGGPGAIFWMICAGFFGMTSKFVECTLAQMYRRVAPDGTVSGGPMRYLYDGLAEMNNAPMRILGIVLSVTFGLLCIGASFGGGCAFQVVQSMGVLKHQIPLLEDYGIVYGIIMAILVGLVIVGGIRRIAATAEKIVPTMCLVYVGTAIVILIARSDQIGWAFGEILDNAFTGDALKGGIIGVMVVGIQRAAFSNEAGTGSAAIAHSAAKTDQPVREGIVAMMGPFIDTIVICTMTGLVIVITKVYDAEIFPEYKVLVDNNLGATLTSVAFESVYSWFPVVLSIAVVLFAYSTMISWSYYGERCVTHLLGQRASLPYKIIFLAFVVLGSVVSATKILDFSDLMILSMALPNILGAILLSGKVRAALNTYWASYKAGEFKTFK
jgi:AGCS family alanine or glycine:cation symporter